MTVLAQPRLLALNNEPAVVRGVRKDPGGEEEITLGVTAQGADGIVMLSVSPIVNVREGDAAKKNSIGTTTIREADTLARLRDGETIVLSGFARNRAIEARTSGGTRGGWFGRTTVRNEEARGAACSTHTANCVLKCTKTTTDSPRSRSA